MPLISKPVARIKLDGIVFSKGERCKPMMIHRMAPPEGPPPQIARDAMEAVEGLRKGRMDMEKGPYADDADAVQGFCDYVSIDAGTRLALVERVASAINDPGSFGFDDGIVFDGPLSAGTILTDRRRQAPGDVTLFTHLMEPFILAVSVLRRKGIESYPALAIFGDEEFEPVIALVDLLEDAPLATIPLSAAHPPMHSLDLLGDHAIVGVSHAIAAENMARQLARDTLSGMMLRGDLPPEEDVDRAILSISDRLHSSYMEWPQNIFVEKALGFLESTMSRAYALLSTAFLRSRRSEMGQDEFRMQIDLLSIESAYLGKGLAKRAEGYLYHRIRADDGVWEP